MRSIACFVAGVGLFLGAPPRVEAQDTTRVDSAAHATPNTRHAVTPSDTIHRPTTPMGAMFRSFLFPGWGQAVYGRKVTAGVMMGFEGLAVGMLLKVKGEERYDAETGSANFKDKRLQEQDWITLIVFTHLMSGLEAYVSAHLYDFPGDLEMRTLPAGGTGVGVRIPLGPR